MAGQDEAKIYTHRSEEIVMKAVEAKAYLSSGADALDRAHMQAEQQEGAVQKSDAEYLKDLLYGLYPDGSMYSDTYPINPPTPPQPEELAELSMSEKKARREEYKKAQELYNERSQIWSNLVAERRNEDHIAEIEHERAEYEKERRKKKETLMSNPNVVAALKRINELKDEKERFAAIKEFLQTAAAELLNDETFGAGVKEECGITADYTEITTGLKIAIAENLTTDTAAGERLSGDLNSLESKYLKLQDRNVNLRAISFEITEVFREEFATLPEFGKAEIELQEEYQRDLNTVQGEYDAFEPEVIKHLGLAKEQVAKYFKHDKLDEFRLRVKEAMDKSGLAYAEAEKQVLADMRESMLKQCEAISLSANVEGEKCTKEIWEKSGAATFHRVMPAGDAQKIVEQSGGFLCAVKYGTKPGMVELKPSLPETIVLGSKTVKLRETYNKAVKKMMTILLNEDGTLTEKADLYAAELTSLFDGLPLDCLSSELIEAMGPDLISDFREILIADDAPMMRETKLTSAIATIRSGDKLKDKKSPEYKALRKELLSLKIPAVDEKGQPIYKREIEVDPLLGQPMLDKNGKPTYTEPQLQYIDLYDDKNSHYIDEAIEACLKDVEKARLSMMQVREMDTDSPQVPIINACSANALYLQGLKELKAKERGVEKTDSTKEAEAMSRRLWYHDAFHYYNRAVSDPENKEEAELRKRLKSDAISKLTANLEFSILLNYKSVEAFIAASKKSLGVRSFSDIRDSLTRYKAYLDGKAPEGYGEKDAAKADTLFNICAQMTEKYDYHQAAPINRIGDLLYTTEGFAAESTQFMVEPFTFHSAIGAYKGAIGDFNISGVPSAKDASSEGMIEYYRSTDDPFACSIEGMLKQAIKISVGRKNAALGN